MLFGQEGAFSGLAQAVQNILPNQVKRSYSASLAKYAPSQGSTKQIS
jgi:hypothetical protein